MRVLILGGTGEARALAAALVGREGFEVVSSLAGRVSNPALPAGEVRVGGFGGITGLIDYLGSHEVHAVVDATHPFAATISTNAAEACRRTGRALLAVRRPAWTSEAGDAWIEVADIRAAAERVAALAPGCVFLTTGRRDLAAFADDDRHHYLVRTVEPPTAPCPVRSTLLLDRGPYTVEGELALMRQHDVSALVTKNSGGSMTYAKLLAARHLGRPVVMVSRPPSPVTVPAVDSVADALAWLQTAYASG